MTNFDRSERLAGPKFADGFIILAFSMGEEEEGEGEAAEEEEGQGACLVDGTAVRVVLVPGTSDARLALGIVEHRARPALHRCPTARHCGDGHAGLLILNQ